VGSVESQDLATSDGKGAAPPALLSQEKARYYDFGARRFTTFLCRLMDAQASQASG